MKLSVLASGSSGNCFYVENNEKAVLIDAGISAKQICERLALIGRRAEKIKAIFITHEHADHVRGVDVFARNFKIPIYANRKTAKNCFLCSDDRLINHIKKEEIVRIAGMEIEAFSKSHKAAEPVYYTLENGKKISIITDAGYACSNITSCVNDSDFLCIEANHDREMLEDGPYPYFLKKWILGNEGHLSNKQAGLCVLEFGSSKLKNIILSHLSKINNTPKIAFKTFSSLVKERVDLSPRIWISERENPTSLIKV